jgi:hypothetical protein
MDSYKEYLREFYSPRLDKELADIEKEQSRIAARIAANKR